jgi:1-acyl-sn-glycerol-3-phosphate acyltransferase
MVKDMKAVQKNQFQFDGLGPDPGPEIVPQEAIASVLPDLAPIADHYFRAQLIVQDLELANSTPSNSVIFVGNHSGMNLPWDGTILLEKLWRRYGGGFRVRVLAAPALFNIPVLHWYGLTQIFKYMAVKAGTKNFEYLAANNINAIVYPEGIEGIAKGFQRKYQLQKFHSSFVRVALKYDKAIVPVYTINGEYFNPLAFRSELLNRFVQKFGIPFMPIGLMTLPMMIFPFVFYAAWPTRLRYVAGPRIDLRKMAGKDHDQLTDGEILKLTNDVQALMQKDLTVHVAEHGKVKFGFSEFFHSFRTLGWKSIFLAPMLWPFVYHRSFLGPNAKKLDIAKAALLCLTLNLPLVGWPLFLMYLALRKKR